MKIDLQYGRQELSLKFPDDSIVYTSGYRPVANVASQLLVDSLANPISGESLSELLKKKREGKVVIVVSDITRPIPYAQFLPQLIAEIEKSGVRKEEIMILVATGMHRASTQMEHLSMFGEFIVRNYRILDHDCQDAENLRQLSARSWSGSEIRLNKHYVQAGFRLVTGLVEPHFMAGFSGGRKAICPGLVDLDTIRKFHGYQFLSHSRAVSSVMEENPCNQENSSVARLCPPDYSVNVVLDQEKRINHIVSGELFASHFEAVKYVKEACCPVVAEEADLAVTSCGGYPLDATFYQCVKGFVNCLPAIKKQGEIIAFGSCMEGIGSQEFTGIMEKYSGNHRQFILDISRNSFFIKDQWQLQMLIRVLDKIGQDNLHFFTSNITTERLSLLSVHPHAVSVKELESSIQRQIDAAISSKKRVAVFPEGPYCSPYSVGFQ
jgi:nickel-dependent lactate racemase